MKRALAHKWETLARLAFYGKQDIPRILGRNITWFEAQLLDSAILDLIVNERKANPFGDGNG